MSALYRDERWFVRTIRLWAEEAPHAEIRQGLIELVQVLCRRGIYMNVCRKVVGHGRGQFRTIAAHMELPKWDKKQVKEVAE